MTFGVGRERIELPVCWPWVKVEERARKMEVSSRKLVEEDVGCKSHQKTIEEKSLRFRRMQKYRIGEDGEY